MGTSSRLRSVIRVPLHLLAAIRDPLVAREWGSTAVSLAAVVLGPSVAVAVGRSLDPLQWSFELQVAALPISVTLLALLAIYRLDRELDSFRGEPIANRIDLISALHRYERALYAEVQTAHQTEYFPGIGRDGGLLPRTPSKKQIALDASYMARDEFELQARIAATRPGMMDTFTRYISFVHSQPIAAEDGARARTKAMRTIRNETELLLDWMSGGG